MLILSRQPGESIKIGNEITVTVLGRRNTEVRLGVDAPINVEILREELQCGTTKAEKFDEQTLAEHTDVANCEQKILIVEDEQINQKIECWALKPFNCCIDIASTGAEALVLVKKNRYDLILMDLGLPDVEGLDLLKQIRLEFRIKTPIIVLTAHGVDQQQRCLNAGANAFFEKPFDLKLLLNCVKKWLIS